MVVAKDARVAERLRFLQGHAMDPKRRYWHSDAGYGYCVTNLQAAMGCPPGALRAAHASFSAICLRLAWQTRGSY